jgi:hypothetical protein
VQRALEEPVVELDPVLGERPADPLDQEPDALDGELGGAPVRGVGDLLGELAYVVARVAVLGRLLPARPREDRLAEPVDLTAGVVEVVLALDLVADEAQDPPQCVAVRRVAAARGGQRPGRVGGDELDLDPLARLGLAAAVAVAGRQHRGRRRGVPGVGEEDVEEAGPGDLHALEPLAEPLGQLLAELLRDLARRRLQRRGQQHRSVGGEIAEAGLARLLQRGPGLQRRRAVAQVGGGRLDGVTEVVYGVHFPQ